MDHRIASGKYAGDFLGAMVEELEQPVKDNDVTKNSGTLPNPRRPPVPQERDFLLGLYERMMVIRQFEDGIKFLFLEGIMPGTIHQCQGQEATAVGRVRRAAAERFHHLHVSRARPRAGQGPDHAGTAQRAFRRDDRLLQGKGGSMHVGNMAKGMIPGIAIVGGGIPVAAGMALAFKMQKSGQVVACFFGDGAVAEGAFHEGVNMAAIWKLPVVFACENNLYGASTHVSQVMRDTNIARRAACYGIRGQQVDGNDVLAVYEAAEQAVGGMPGGQRARAPGDADLSPHRALAARPLPLSAEGGARGLGRQGPAGSVRPGAQGPRSRRRRRTGSGQDARCSINSTEAVETARRAALPTLADLTTDVFV